MSIPNRHCQLTARAYLLNLTDTFLKVRPSSLSVWQPGTSKCALCTSMVRLASAELSSTLSPLCINLFFSFLCQGKKGASEPVLHPYWRYLAVLRVFANSRIWSRLAARSCPTSPSWRYSWRFYGNGPSDRKGFASGRKISTSTTEISLPPAQMILERLFPGRGKAEAHTAISKLLASR